MICTPCQEPHHEQDCIDQQAQPPREGALRWCYCQHGPRADGRRPRSQQRQAHPERA